MVDTSAWIEWIADGPRGAHLVRELPRREDWIVPTIVQLELSKWLLREKFEDGADSLIAFTQKCRVVPLDTATAIMAADLCRRHGLATADAIIYATALRFEADLLTCDAHFEGLPGVTFVAKGA